jgi:hypothetical protein
MYSMAMPSPVDADQITGDEHDNQQVIEEYFRRSLTVNLLKIKDDLIHLLFN